MSDESAVVTAKAQQRQHSKRATMEALRRKKPAEKDLTITVDGEEVSFFFRAIGNIPYDKLINSCPATTEQLARGMQVNQDKLAPLLLSKVCVEPGLTVDEWTELWNSPDWGRGELMELYNEAGMLCQKGLDVTPTAAG